MVLENTRKAPFALFALLFILFAAVASFTGYYYLIAIPFALLFFYAGWERINAVFMLLLISLPISAEYQVTDTLGTDFPDEFLMLFVSVLFFCYQVYRPGSLSKQATLHPLVIILLAGFCWAALSSLFSTQPVLSFKYLLAKSWYMGAFILAPLIVFRDKQLLRKAILVLTISMLLVTIITLFRHYTYGFSFASVNNALRPFFRNHVNYSAMLVCLIPVVFACMQSMKRKEIKIASGMILLILLIALFLSYARGAWLALLTGILAAFLIRKKMLGIAYTFIVIIALTSFIWLKSDDRYLNYAHNYHTTVWHADFREHLAATYQLKDVSTAERFYRWIAGIRMIKDNGLTGYGPNSFYYTYRPYTIPAFKTWVSDNTEHSTVHNYFLLLLIEQGIPGLLFFLLLAGAMLYYAQHLYHRCHAGFYKTVAITAGVITVMILTVNFLSDLIETDKIGSLFYLCLSVLVVTDVNTRKIEASEQQL